MVDVERWQQIEGYGGVYEISSFGRVRNTQTRKLLKLSDSGNGYFKIHLSHKGYMKFVWVHRLVAEAFIQNPDNLPQVNHKDGNKLNNSVDNLEWCTQKENSVHAYRMGLTPKAPKTTGENHPNHKLTETDIKEIKTLYSEDSKGFSQRKLARMFGVSQTTIKNILKNRSWREINDTL